MRLARGPRPWAIRLFALLFVGQAIGSFWQNLTHLAATQAMIALIAPEWPHDSDAAIVYVSARLTIALIPVALVWLLASRIARWLVLALALGKLVMLPLNLSWLPAGEAPSPLWLASQFLSVLGAGLLLTPAAARWFRLGVCRAADTFA